MTTILFSKTPALFQLYLTAVFSKLYLELPGRFEGILLLDVINRKTRNRSELEMMVNPGPNLRSLKIICMILNVNVFVWVCIQWAHTIEYTLFFCLILSIHTSSSFLSPLLFSYQLLLSFQTSLVWGRLRGKDLSSHGGDLLYPSILISSIQTSALLK